MTKLRWMATGETTADWEERLYHAIIPVHKGIAETDDTLAIEILLRSGFERVPDDVSAPVAPKASTASSRRAVEKG